MQKQLQGEREALFELDRTRIKMEDEQWELQGALDEERSGREAAEAEAARMATKIRDLEATLRFEREERGRRTVQVPVRLAKPKHSAEVTQATGASTTSRHKAENVRMELRRGARRGRPGARARRRAAGYPIAPGG